MLACQMVCSLCRTPIANHIADISWDISYGILAISRRYYLDSWCPDPLALPVFPPLLSRYFLRPGNQGCIVDVSIEAELLVAI